MVKLTFYGGINEIGGNKILVETKEASIFLDFGQSFCLLDDYFCDFLMPRERFGLRDYFALGLMPKLKGLYNAHSLKGTEVEYTEPEYDAVFISHAHQDHTAHLRYLDQRIPIYVGETAKTILDATQETTNSFFFSETEWRKKNQEKTLMPANVVKTFRTGQKVKIGDIAVTPIHVDHSVPGAYGFIVETNEGTIAYTGDLRKHGNKPELTRDFLEAAKKSEPDMLVIEGTRVKVEETRKNHTESFVQSESTKIAKQTEGLILAMRYPKDLDRFRTFYRIAKETGRKLVISPKTAHLLLSLEKDRALALPNPLKDDLIEVYSREKLTYGKWERAIMDAHKCVDCEWMAKNQKKAMWELDFSFMNELVDVKPAPGACIHSMSEPFEEDPMSQLQDEVLRNWLDRFSLTHNQLHASGHASTNEIFEMVDFISAKRVVPVHTQYPEMFEKNCKGVTLMKKGEKVKIG
jgi:ribonuclease J